MERLTVMKSLKLAGPASLANILKTVDNIFANRCSRRLGRPIRFNSSSEHSNVLLVKSYGNIIRSC